MDLENLERTDTMTSQPHPYRPQHSQQQPSPQTPGPSGSDGHSPGTGDARARRVTRTPYVAPRFPVSTTALSQADGEA